MSTELDGFARPRRLASVGLRGTGLVLAVCAGLGKRPLVTLRCLE